jgi:adenosine deaminase CECR1
MSSHPPEAGARAYAVGDRTISLPERYPDRASYMAARAALQAEVEKPFFGRDEALDADEERVDAYLKGLVAGAIAYYKAHGEAHFPPAECLWRVKGEIEATPLFALLRAMPKGGLLHVHNSAMGRAEKLVELANHEACYVACDAQGRIAELRYFRDAAAIAAREAALPPEKRRRWERVRDRRAADPGFDGALLRALTLGEDDLATGDVWGEFGRCFGVSAGLVNFWPTLEAYYLDAFEGLRADGVQHVEIRAIFGKLYDLGGEIEFERSVALQMEYFRTYMQAHPEFTIRVIACGTRRNPLKQEAIAQVLAMREAHPDLVVGFDMVGPEDAGHPTIDYLDQFLPLQAALPFYFHDGESDWPTNDNVIDAIMLNTRRIGHGFNLYKFPYLMGLVREKDIALEVCPLSNQSLRYVADLRDHPALTYLANGLPVTLSSDDPGIFGNHGLSYDFWAAAMSWQLDLKALKKLARNSLAYSALEGDRAGAIARWESAWQTFIRRTREALLDPRG